MRKLLSLRLLHDLDGGAFTVCIACWQLLFFWQ
jgi:hypothetical protein